MKNSTMKKLAGIAAIVTLASCMFVPMGMTTFAADDAGSITITTTETGHTYEAWQIFDGDYDEATGILSNITWGKGVAYLSHEDAIVAELQAIAINMDTPFKDCTTAADFAKVLSEFDNSFDAELTKKFAAVIGKYLAGSTTQLTVAPGGYKVENVEYGYWLVMDTDAGVPAMTRYILRVVGDAEANPKSSYPEVIKKVKENSTNTVNPNGEEFAGDDNYQVGNQYNDVADYDIGDIIPFQLYGTLPSNLDDYSAYYYKFTDTLGKEFDDFNDIEVFIDGTQVGYKYGNGNNNLKISTVDDEEGNHILTVTFEDIKQAVDMNDKTIAVTKDSIVTVTYTASLTQFAVIGLNGQTNEVKLTYSNNPNDEYAPDTTDENDDTPDSTHDTPVDKVIVFTYELDVNKVNGATQEKLEGAEFILYCLNGDTKYYATVSDKGYFEGWVSDETDATTLTSNEDGLFKVIGIDEGTYYLQETKAPAGYNLAANPFEVKLDATTVNDQVWDDFDPTKALTAISVSVGDGTPKEGDVNTGAASITIQNSMGSSLPSTGGIGTTLFYVIGGTMAAGAGVYLISKKRMNNKED